MLRKKRGHSFGSALGGGAVVAVAGLLAIATGLIGGAGGSTTTPSAVLAAPATTTASSVNRDETNVINQIYKADGDGVAFIESQEAEGSPPARAS